MTVGTSNRFSPPRPTASSRRASDRHSPPRPTPANNRAHVRFGTSGLSDEQIRLIMFIMSCINEYIENNRYAIPKGERMNLDQAIIDDVFAQKRLSAQLRRRELMAVVKYDTDAWMRLSGNSALTPTTRDVVFAQVRAALTPIIPLEVELPKDALNRLVDQKLTETLKATSPSPPINSPPVFDERRPSSASVENNPLFSEPPLSSDSAPSLPPPVWFEERKSAPPPTPNPTIPPMDEVTRTGSSIWTPKSLSGKDDRDEARKDKGVPLDTSIPSKSSGVPPIAPPPAQSDVKPAFFRDIPPEDVPQSPTRLPSMDAPQINDPWGDLHVGVSTGSFETGNTHSPPPLENKSGGKPGGANSRESWSDEADDEFWGNQTWGKKEQPGRSFTSPAHVNRNAPPASPPVTSYPLPPNPPREGSRKDGASGFDAEWNDVEWGGLAAPGMPIYQKDGRNLGTEERGWAWRPLGGGRAEEEIPEGVHDGNASRITARSTMGWAAVFSGLLMALGIPFAKTTNIGPFASGNVSPPPADCGLVSTRSVALPTRELPKETKILNHRLGNPPEDKELLPGSVFIIRGDKETNPREVREGERIFFNQMEIAPIRMVSNPYDWFFLLPIPLDLQVTQENQGKFPVIYARSEEAQQNSAQKQIGFVQVTSRPFGQINYRADHPAVNQAPTEAEKSEISKVLNFSRTQPQCHWGGNLESFVSPVDGLRNNESIPFGTIELKQNQPIRQRDYVTLMIADNNQHASVKAPHSGIVRLMVPPGQPNWPYYKDGLMIIDHGGGIVSMLQGMTFGRNLEPGTYVRQGQQIGKVGGDRLNWTLTLNGVPVDPASIATDLKNKFQNPPFSWEAI